MIMEGNERREELIKLLNRQNTPISGTELAKIFGVSRQVIVQDIALLRANDKNILSTNKGYILFSPDPTQNRWRRSYPMFHTAEQMREELYTIVDCGGKILDVVVSHEIYGQITCDLILNNRIDVDDFLSRIEKSDNNPLSFLTGGAHWHTVEADKEETLDLIEKLLLQKGFLKN